MELHEQRPGAPRLAALSGSPTTIPDERFERAAAGVLGPAAARRVLEVVARADTAAFVGGWVRDVVLGRESDDLDVAAADPDGLVDSLMAAGGRNRVLLDPVRRTWRVTFGRGWVDVTGLRGETLNEDMTARDLRCNAMAWSPRGGLQDPLEGLADLQSRTLRLASPDALREDPLRALRVWRFAIQLDATPAVDVTGAELGRVAAERTRSELHKILVHPDAARALDGLQAAGLLTSLLPGTLRLDVHRRAVVATAHGPALARCWAEAERKRVAVPLGWLCPPDDLEPALLARRWPKQVARSAAATSREVGAEGATIGRALGRWKRQAAFALLGRAAGATDPDALVASYLAALDTAPGARNPRGLPVPPVPAALLNADAIREHLGLKGGPGLGTTLEALVAAQIDGEVKDRAGALAWIDRRQG